MILGKQLIMPDVWTNLMRWLPSDIHFIRWLVNLCLLLEAPSMEMLVT
jgi:hypothetical protein